MLFEYIHNYKVLFYDCVMIKLKLTDPLKRSPDVEEYLLDDAGYIIFFRAYSQRYHTDDDLKWTRLENRRVLGYLRVTHTLSDEGSQKVRRNADLGSFADREKIGFSPLIAFNSHVNASAEISSLSIEEIVAGFDTGSIPANQIRQQ
jgi:hypothetical protein